VSLRVNALLKIRELCADFYEDDPSFQDQMERALCELETGARQEQGAHETHMRWRDANEQQINTSRGESRGFTKAEAESHKAFVEGFYDNTSKGEEGE
jgi:hypothetical protein